LRSSNKDLQRKQSEIDELVKEFRKLELKIKKLHQDVEKVQNDKEHSAELVENMFQNYFSTYM